MDNEIRLLIADDHPLIRHGLRQCIQEEPDLKIVAEAGDGQTALKLIRELSPQIAILDIGMPLLDGFGVAREVFKEKLLSKLFFLTAHREESLFAKALELGVTGYVLKESVMSDIVSGIRVVAAGQHYVSPVLTRLLLTRGQTRQTTGLQALTPTERRVLKLIAENKSSKEIAAKLFISYYTVETHRKNICDKLDLHGGYALLKFALEHKTELT